MASVACSSCGAPLPRDVRLCESCGSANPEWRKPLSAPHEMTVIRQWIDAPGATRISSPVTKVTGPMPVGKWRRPWVVLVLSYLTLTAWFSWWYWRINIDLQGDGDDYTRPNLSLLAVTFGWLLVLPPFISFWRTGSRIAAAQQERGVHAERVALVGTLLFPVFGLGIVWYQHQLNKISV